MNILSLRIIKQSNIFQSFQNNLIRSTFDGTNLIQTRGYAARKGTREKKKKAKVKVEIKKVGFIPHNQRDREKFLAERPKLKFDDSLMRDPVDDVFVCKYYKWVVYPFQEAVKCHRETHHPDMYNKPNEKLHVSIELNMIGEKKTRLVDNFTKIAAIPHKFDQGEERSVIAFSKNPEYQKAAQEAGAQLVGGPELIKQIQNGQVSLTDFKYVVAHPEILPDLVVLRGLLKKKFPNPKLGNLDTDLGAAVHKFLHGISYSAVKDEYEKDFGLVQTTIGSLDMELNHLEENFAALVRDIYTMKPKRAGDFISRCILWSPPSPEKLKVDHLRYLDLDESNQTKSKQEEEIIEEEAKVDERIIL